jgi:hypothetical protein
LAEAAELTPDIPEASAETSSPTAVATTPEKEFGSLMAKTPFGIMLGRAPDFQ